MSMFRKTKTEKAVALVLKHSKQQPLLVPVAIFFTAKNGEMVAKGTVAAVKTTGKALKYLGIKLKEWGSLVAEEASAQFSKLKSDDEIV